MALTIRSRFALVVGILLATALLLYWLLTRQDTPRDLDTSSPPQPSPVGTAVNRVRSALERPRQIQGIASAKNVPIQFWGKIVDQDGVSLAGVLVRAKVRSWRASGLAALDSIYVPLTGQTTADGEFQLNGASGDVLTIEAMHKDGYETEPSALRSFGYNISTNIVPDSNNPVILRMWRSDIRLGATVQDKRFSIIPDGRLYTIDLVLGRILESSTAVGDMRVAIKRPSDVTQFGQRYDWNLSINPVNGGLQEEPDLYSSMYLAPTTGYSNSLTRQYESIAKTWSPVYKSRVYLTARGGLIYARLQLDLSSFYGPEDTNGRVRIQYVVNTNGARILR